LSIEIYSKGVCSCSQNRQIFNFFIRTFEFDGAIIPGGDNADGEIPPVPEPSTVLLLGSGVAGLAWYGRKRKKA